MQFWDQSEELAREERPIYVETKSRCSMFEESWREIGLVDGRWEPPDAGVDLTECDGLEQFDADMRLATVTALAENPDLVPAFIAARTMEDLSPLAPEELRKVIAGIPRDAETLGLLRKMSGSGPLPPR